MLRACPEVPMYRWRVKARLWEATGHASYFMDTEPALCIFCAAHVERVDLAGHGGHGWILM